MMKTVLKTCSIVLCSIVLVPSPGQELNDQSADSLYKVLKETHNEKPAESVVKLTSLPTSFSKMMPDSLSKDVEK